MDKENLELTNSELFNIRVIQKNLVYVIGLPQKYADENILRRHEFFGQFGNIKKIIVNKRCSIFENRALEAAAKPCICEGSYHKGSDVLPRDPRSIYSTSVEYRPTEITASAYITFSNDFEAKWCILDVDESILDGRQLKCTYGTTKFCSFYLKNIACQNIECMYLHEWREQKDILTKDELIGSRHKLHDFEGKNKNSERIGKKRDFKFLDELIQLKAETEFKPPKKILFEPADL
ncbi:CCR4-NOT transcription complex subunit 4 [Enteropsectra breve]|nr:CCR4-NOT transcription complex subunit 4 [Enteropsectra breve]